MQSGHPRHSARGRDAALIPRSQFAEDPGYVSYTPGYSSHTRDTVVARRGARLRQDPQRHADDRRPKRSPGAPSRLAVRCSCAWRVWVLVTTRIDGRHKQSAADCACSRTTSVPVHFRGGVLTSPNAPSARRPPPVPAPRRSARKRAGDSAREDGRRTGLNPS